MKFISLASLSIFAISFLLPVSAAPAVSKNAQQVIDYINDAAHKANIDPPCFFSGRTKVTTLDKKGKPVTVTKTAEGELAKWRQGKNCPVIAEIVAAAKVKTSVLTNADWKDVSTAFAEAVSGQVYVLLGKEVREDSVWLKDEAPALKKNKKVTGVEIWEIEKDGKVVKTSK